MERIQVSIVEDIQDIREGLKFLLNQEQGFNCLQTYANATDALRGLMTDVPDIVIMDINLPDMSGVDCMRKVKARHPQVQFIIFTIYENSDQVFEALAAGANGYLLKNASSAKIMEALRELHDGGSPMSASIARKVVASFQPPQIVSSENEKLSARETDVLDLLAKGLLYKEIADQLRISTGTVRQHIHNIYQKLHVQNRTEALNKAFRNTRQ
jgi:DNA-binding NarL/FixJ family response regulator